MSRYGPEFFETRMGRTYYEVTLPTLIRNLERLIDLLERDIALRQGAERQGTAAAAQASGASPASNP